MQILKYTFTHKDYPMKKLYIFLVLLLLCTASVFSSETNIQSAKTNKSQRFAIVPAVAYLPESSVIFAVMGTFFLNPDRPKQRKPSSLAALLAVSVKKQITLNILPDIYFINDTLHLKGVTAFLLWPAYFYGLGPDTKTSDKELYTAKGIVWDGGIEYFPKIFDRTLAFGIVQRIGYEDITPEADGLLVTENVAGKDGGLFSGLGAQVTFDTRDRIHWTSKGIFFQYYNLFFSSMIGSDFTFSEHKFDYRHFISLAQKHTLALSANIKLQTGNPYFRYGSTPDIRAIEVGRYRDLHLFLVRSEYRFPIAWKFNGVLFASAALVSDSFKNIDYKNTVTSIGTGVRFAMIEKEMLNLRLDLAWVDNGFNLEFILSEKF
jgi:hypothetical protein